jgi:hypothetical protein
VGRIAQSIEKMGKLPAPFLALHMFGKSLLGLALGTVLGGPLNVTEDCGDHYSWRLQRRSSPPAVVAS